MAISCLLAVASAGTWWVQQSPPAIARPSIAILPIENLGDDEATTRLAGGLTEDLTTDLSRINEFDVIASSATKDFKDNADVSEIGRSLNVRYVLQGSIQREGDRIRASVQLIDTRSGVHIWGNRWDRPIADVFAVQTEIADSVFAQLAATLGPIKSADLNAARRKTPQSLTAYDLTLLAVEKQLSPTRDSIDESIVLLKKAVAADPAYSRAWTNLAWAYSLATNFGADWDKSSQAALDAAQKAVTLDPNDSEAHAALGEVLAYRGEFGRAKSEYEIALRLNPGAYSTLTYYAGWAAAFGETERGAEMADRAINLNPSYQPWASNAYRYAYFMAKRFEDALKVMDRQTEDNYSTWAWVERAGSFAFLGRMEEAKKTVAEALKRFPDLTIEGFANSPGMSEVDRTIHVEAMEKAGFPPCARPEILAKLSAPFRLAGCKTS